MEVFLLIGAQTRNVEKLGVSSRVAVESALDLVLELVDNDLFDAALDSTLVGVEIGLIGEEILQQRAESLVDIARAV
jgi:hypothetical protein